MRQTDVWVGLGMAVFAAVVLFFVVPNEIPDRMVSGMSVAFFPKLLLGSIIVLSVLLTLLTLFRARSAPAAAESQKEPEKLSLDIMLLLSLPVSYFIVQYLGISIFALLVTPPVMIVYGEKRWGLIAVTAVTIAICAHLVVVQLLERPPLGLW